DGSVSRPAARAGALLRRGKDPRLPGRREGWAHLGLPRPRAGAPRPGLGAFQLGGRPRPGSLLRAALQLAPVPGECSRPFRPDPVPAGAGQRWAATNVRPRGGGLRRVRVRFYLSTLAVGRRGERVGGGPQRDLAERALHRERPLLPL